MAVGTWEYCSTFLDGVLLPMLLEILETDIESAASLACIYTFLVHFANRLQVWRSGV